MRFACQFFVFCVAGYTFIFSKLLLLLASDLIFTTLLTFINVGFSDGLAILTSVLIQAGILSLIMSPVGFFFAVSLIFLVILSAYIASLIGLFIGYFSSGLMVGIVYIKIVMIMFLAPPIVFYLMISANSPLYPIYDFSFCTLPFAALQLFFQD